MLDHDGAAIDGLHKRGVHVAHLHLVLMVPIARRIRSLGISLEVKLVGLQRHEIVETIASVDTHVLHERNEAVRHILVALVNGVPAKAPMVVQIRRIIYTCSKGIIYTL